MKHCATVNGRFPKACRVLFKTRKKTYWCCHGDESLQRITTARWTRWIKCWVRSRSGACRALVQQLVVKDTVERMWILVSTRSQTRGRVCRSLVAGRCETCCNTSRDTANRHANTSELSLSEQYNLHVWLRSVAIRCIGQNGRGVCYERSEIANGRSRCAGTAAVDSSGKVFGWLREVAMNYPYQDNPSQMDFNNTIVNDS